LLCVLATAMQIAACARVGEKPAPAPVEDRAGTAVTSPAVPDGAGTRWEEIPAPEGGEAPPQPAEPAVVALLDESDRKLRNGDHEAAAAAVERALRLSPSNATLWHRLGVIRADQGRWSQAEAMAQKSLSLSGSDPRLQADNWKLIARARRGLGDAAGARAAESAAARATGSAVN
jgi:tetratricopeptide (TPR) repeat protein